MADDGLHDNTEVAPAPTECVMIKEEPDNDYEYDSSERNPIDNVEGEQEMDTADAEEPSVFHGTYLPEPNIMLKRKANDSFRPGFEAVSGHYTVPVSSDVNPNPPLKKKTTRTYQKNIPTNRNAEDEENSLRIQYLVNASKTEERVRNLQMELNKARLEREKMELENLKELHHLRLEKLKLEKEVLALKLKNATETGVA